MDNIPDFYETDDEWEGVENGGDELEFDCGMDSRGWCRKAGSEECDFECPYRDLLKG